MDVLNQGFTSFRGVNTRGSIAFRFVADTYGNESTLAVKPSEDQAYAWKFPQKSGTFPICGTFSVDLPVALSNKQVFSTLVTVSNIRAEDGLTVSFQKETGTYTYGGSTTMYILSGAYPGNGNITLTFQNLGQGTGYLTGLVFGYTAVR